MLSNPRAGARATAQAATGLGRLAGAVPTEVDDSGGADCFRDFDLVERARVERSGGERERLWRQIDLAMDLAPGPGRDAMLDQVEAELGPGSVPPEQ